MDFKIIQKAVHQVAVQKGWWKKGSTKSDVESLALVVCELAEAIEEIRNDRPPVYTLVCGQIRSADPLTPAYKPEGTLIELADAVIRIMDLCEQRGWDLEKAIHMKHEYNKTRTYRHGGKKL